MKTAGLVFFSIKIYRKTRSEEERGRLPFTHTGGYFFRCSPEVHKTELPPEPGIRVRRVSKKRRLYDNTVRGLKGCEQFLYLHKKKANSVLGDLPKLVPRDTGVATQKNDPKGIVDQMPEPAKAFVGDRQEPLARHEMSGQTEKLASGKRSIRGERTPVIWHLTGSGRLFNQVCLGRTEVFQTLDCEIDLRGEVGWIVKVPSQVPSQVPPTVPSQVPPMVPPSMDSSHGTSKESIEHQKFQERRSFIKLTTSHLLWPNEPRRAAFLLPFWRPNSNVLRSDCKRAGCGLAIRDRLCLTGVEGVKAEEATPILPIGQHPQKILTKRGSRCVRGRTGEQRLSYKFCKAARAYRCCGKNMPRCGVKIVERMSRYSRVINIT